MKLADVLYKDSIISDLKSKSKTEVLKEFSSYVSKVLQNLNSEKIYETLIEREKLCSTAIDEGVAIPHCKFGGVTNFIAVFGRSKGGIDFESLDGKPTQLFILILSPDNSSGDHIKVLARVSKIFKNSETRSRLMKASSNDEIYNILIDEDDKF